ncbi:MAG: sugar phosphate isomerase/epimerase [Gemmatimonadetes bacterium]|nr:sugar phosphate isomerase/epimerase [Gemmatimonadota bacterium]
MTFYLPGRISRRSFLAGAAVALPAAYSFTLSGCGPGPAPDESGDSDSLDSLFRISLAEWSLHRALNAGELDNLEFPRVAKEEYGIDGVEYVNSFFKDKAEDFTYLADLKTRCDGLGVTSVLIMCDGEGAIGDPDEAARTQAVENHFRWVEAARYLGCHSIRVNAQSQGTPEEQRDLAADGLRRLSEFADGREINVVVENHGGLSSNGAWLSSVMRAVDHPRCGTLPDFGNFNIGGGETYDRYLGIEELMAFAKAVSAKSHIFDAEGNEAEMDFTRIMRSVLQAGYRGWVGIEYEGSEHSEPEGIRLTKALLERVRVALAPEFQTAAG